MNDAVAQEQAYEPSDDLIDPERDLPSDPAMRKKLVDAVIQIDASMSRQQGEKEYQSETIKRLAKEVGMKGAKIRKFAKWYAKGNAKKDAIEVSAEAAAYDILFKNVTGAGADEQEESAED